MNLLYAVIFERPPVVIDIAVTKLYNLWPKIKLSKTAGEPTRRQAVAGVLRSWTSMLRSWASMLRSWASMLRSWAREGYTREESCAPAELHVTKWSEPIVLIHLHRVPPGWGTSPSLWQWLAPLVSPQEGCVSATTGCSLLLGSLSQQAPNHVDGFWSTP